MIELGSFDGAAERLHVTPSAISQRIKALEQRVGSLYPASRAVRRFRLGDPQALGQRGVNDGPYEVDGCAAGEHRVMHFQDTKWTARGNVENHHSVGLQARVVADRVAHLRVDVS